MDNQNQEEQVQPTYKSEYHNYLPYVGSIIIFLGVIRLIIFYNYFGISITSYLEFTEIITSFFDILFMSLILLAVSHVFTHLEISHHKSDKQLEKFLPYSESPFLKKQIIVFKFMKRINLIFLFSFIFCLGLIFFLDTFFTKYLWWLLGFYTAAFVFSSVYWELINKYVTNEGGSPIYILLLAFLLAITCIWFNESERVRDMKEYHSTKGTRIILDNDSTLISNSTDYFVGKTQNFVFIYHEKSETADAIPMSRVKQITTAPRK